MFPAPSVHHFASGHSDVPGIDVLLASSGDEREADGLRALLGGKGAGLHALAVRGFRVPPGFTLATGWCEAYHREGRVLPAGLREAIARAVETLETRTGRKLEGRGDPLLVAVRSGAARSMPGMMDTVLNVRLLDGIVEAVERVFLSFESDRAVAYRQRKRLEGLRGTAVVVQEMCPAEAAGVAFTVDPSSGEPAIAVEAVRGLGEALVSGEVTPDRYRLRRGDLQLLETSIRGDRPVLAPDRLREVASLSLQVEEAFGHPVDLEWAVARGETFLLQVRAAAGAPPAAAAGARLRGEAARLRALDRKRAARGGGGEETFLVRHNLDQTLSHPTPMTRDALGELFGRQGAFQRLHLDLGFRPSREVMEEGFLVLVCGRIFADRKRAAEIFYGTSAFCHDREALRRRPELLDEPPAKLGRTTAGPMELLRVAWRMARAQRRLARLREDFPPRFVGEFVPAFLAWCRAKAEADLSALDLPALLDELEERVQATYRRFPREALKMSFFAATAHAELRDLLERVLGQEDGGEASRSLLGLLDGNAGLEQSRMLAALARGEISIETFLESHGHRTADEMELRQPRWREDPGEVWRMARAIDPAAGAGLESRIEERRQAMEAEAERIARKFRAAGGEEAAADFEARLKAAREVMPWRETWKQHWMRGLDLVRRVLLELDRRLGLEGKVFYLTRSELREIAARGGPVDSLHRERIRARQEEERVDRSIALPDCLTAGEIEGLAGDRRPDEENEPGEETRAAALRGEPLSPGRGEGRAWIATHPGEDCPLQAPFVLVCPSTDPGWTPLLARARAVVVERGGALSHGAIVCRDFAVPLVALPGATRSIVFGEPVLVDGTKGTVIRLAAGEAAAGSERPEGGAAAYRIPPEPYVPPSRRGLGRQAAIGIAVAIVASAAMVAIPALRSALLPIVRASLDWTIEAGWTPFACIGFVAAVSALLPAPIQLAAGGRRRFMRMGARMGWYGRQLRAARKAGAAAAAEVLEGRKRQAALERGLELLRPVGWSFLPFCLAFLWVADRFSFEPIRPGTSFTVRAVFSPSSGNGYLRHARLEAGESGTVRILDSPFQKIEPNQEAPSLGPYRARWTLQALAGEGLVRLAVSTRDERLESSVRIFRQGGFASTDTVRFRRPDAPPAEEIVSIDVERPPLRVELPGPAFGFVNGVAKRLSSGRGVTPSQAASGPVLTFLVCAVFLSLFFQRVTGLR